MSQRPSGLITGVSTGIGCDATRYLIAHGYQVFGSVRKAATPSACRRTGRSTSRRCCSMSPTRRRSPAPCNRSQRQWVAPGSVALVNNSGVSGAAPLMHVPIDDVRQMFEVNVFGLLQVTQAFLPLLGARDNCPHAPGRVINISSISGGLVFPFVGAYGGSKHAVEAFSDALRRELGIFGIKVIAIEPGNIRTPIWEKSPEADTRYADTAYASHMAKMPELLAKMGRKARPGTGEQDHPAPPSGAPDPGPATR